MKDFRPNIIIQKLQNGDDTPLYDLYKLYRDEFIAWANSKYEATEDQSKDAFQEAVLGFYENVTSGRLSQFSSTIKTYLFQIGKHKLLNIQKKERRLTYHDAIHLIENEETKVIMEEENKAYTQEEISNAIDRLPDDCRKVLKLYYFKEFDMESIAREMEYKNSNTAKSKKSVCMKKLQEELKRISMFLVL